jgi:hypothetical protein
MTPLISPWHHMMRRRESPELPRTGIEQSQILPRNQAIPQKALQKALQLTHS